MANKDKKTSLKYTTTKPGGGQTTYAGTNWFQQAYEAAKGGAGEGGGFGSTGYTVNCEGVDFGKDNLNLL